MLTVWMLSAFAAVDPVLDDNYTFADARIVVVILIVIAVSEATRLLAQKTHIL